MAVRTFVTSGVAFVAAGAVAATVALAPPLSPRDIQVAKSTEVSLNALVTNPALQDLINAYFNSGAAAVVQQLLIDVVGEDGAPADLINGYFDTGVSEVVRQLLVAANPTGALGTAAIDTFFNGENPFASPDEGGVSGNPALFGASGLVDLALVATGIVPQVPLVNEFFQGGTPLVAQALLLALAPGQAQLINDFFSGGVTKVVQTGLDNALSGRPEQLVNDFFDGGTPQVAYDLLGGDLGTPVTPPDPTDPGALAPTSTPFLSAFFGINNNVLDPNGSGAGGLSGVSGVVLQTLLAATSGDPTAQSLLHGFFETGISEVIRQILVEPPTEAPATASVAANTATFARAFSGADVQDVADVNQGADLKAAGADLNAAGAAAGADLKDLKPVVEKAKAKITTDPVQAVQPVSAPVVSPPAASSPPAQDPAPATPVVVKDEDPVVKDEDPVVKPVVKDDTKDSNDVTEDIKNGNKVEVDPILLLGANGRGPKPGEGSWGVFGQVADAIGKAVSGAVAPKKTPAKSEGASTGGGTGTTGGS